MSSQVIKLTVPYFSQRLDEHNFKQEGFSSLEEALSWSDRICGLACAKMVIGAFNPGLEVPLYGLLSDGLREGAYKDGVGWIHAGLVRVCRKYGVIGECQSVGKDISKIVSNLRKGQIVIASVSPGLEGGKVYRLNDSTPVIIQPGGHLIVIVGARICRDRLLSFLLHHPSSSLAYEWPDYEISVESFSKSFSTRGNIIAFSRSNEARHV